MEGAKLLAFTRTGLNSHASTTVGLQNQRSCLTRGAVRPQAAKGHTTHDVLKFTPRESVDEAALTNTDIREIAAAKSVVWPFSGSDAKTIRQKKAELVAKAKESDHPKKQYLLAIEVLREIPKVTGILNADKKGQLAQTAGAILDLARADERPVFSSAEQARASAENYVEQLVNTGEHPLAKVCRQATVVSSPQTATRVDPESRSAAITALKDAVDTCKRETSLSPEQHERYAVALYACMIYLHNAPNEQAIMRQAGRDYFLSGAKVLYHKQMSELYRGVMALVGRTTP